MKSKSGKKSRSCILHAKIALSWQEKRVSVAPIRREILILARNPDSCRVSGVRKGFRATEMPISCHESVREGIGIQKFRFLAKRRSANTFPNRLRRSEERNAAAFIPPLFNGTEERRKASPFAARFTPTRAATRWRVSPFTPPSPSLHPANAIGYAHAFALPLPSSLPPIRKRACHRRAPGNFPLTIK